MPVHQKLELHESLRTKRLGLKWLVEKKPPLVTTNLNTRSENLGTVVNSRFSGITPVYCVAGVVRHGDIMLKSIAL
jgi:hypothetical protein